MSMSEFEKHMNSEHEWDEQRSPSLTEQPVPADFSEEELAFALELNTLFSPEEEELPPYYVQTLLEAEDTRFHAVDNHFVQRTHARVFRSLKLRRRLFPAQRAALRALGDTLRDITRRKTLLAWVAVLMLFMMFTVAYTAPSFAQGVTLLLHGARSGVLRVPHYPDTKNVKQQQYFLPSARDSNGPSQLNLAAAQQQLHFKIYWPQTIPAHYSLDAINMYDDPQNSWSDGPYIELVYDLDSSRVSVGTGQIVIREFKPSEQVLQLVQDGSVSAIEPDQYGNAKAIYVNGEWLPRGKMSPMWWSYGTRAEVIYQQDGVVFWIAGDQRDGINEKILWNVAQSMQMRSFLNPNLLKGEIITVSQNYTASSGPFANDLLIADDGTDNPYYISVSSYLSGKAQSSKTTPTSKHQ